MTVLITDKEGRPIAPEQLGNLSLWNDTLSHVCATAMARLAQGTPKEKAS